ncbi:MAG: hypothetical protein ACJ763_18145 [Bdellovibrionia bacterium]
MSSKTLSLSAMILVLLGAGVADAAVKVQCKGMVQDVNYCLDDMCSDNASLVLKDFDRPYSMDFRFSGEANSKLNTKDYDYKEHYEFILSKIEGSTVLELEVRAKSSVGHPNLKIGVIRGQKFRFDYKTPVDTYNYTNHVLKCELSE